MIEYACGWLHAPVSSFNSRGETTSSSEGATWGIALGRFGPTAKCSLVRVLAVIVSGYYFFVGLCLVSAAKCICTDYWSMIEGLTNVANVSELREVTNLTDQLRYSLIVVSCVTLFVHLAISVVGVRHIRSLFMQLDANVEALHRVADALAVPHNGDATGTIDVNPKQSFSHAKSCKGIQNAATPEMANDMLMLLHQLRGLLPDSTFEKELTDVAVRQCNGAKLQCEKANLPVGSKLEAHSPRVMSQFRVSRRTAAGMVRNREILEHGGTGTTFRKRRVTVVVVCLSDFAHQVEEDLEHCLHFSRQFLSVVTQIVERYGGIIASVAPNKVVVTWNAFTDSPRHAQNGMQCACDVLVALQPFTQGLSVSPSLKLFPTIVATSGFVMAGTIRVSDHEDDVLSVYGNCISLSEELPSLLGALRVRCACVGALAHFCPSNFSCIPRDCVTDANNKRHIIYEMQDKALAQRRRHVEAFQAFQRGEHGVAHHLYTRIHEETRSDWNALRMSQICYYLEESHSVYTQRFPEWQLFPVEREHSCVNELQLGRRAYGFMKCEASPVEDHIRRAILKQTDTRALPHSYGRNEEESYRTPEVAKSDKCLIVKCNSSSLRYVTEFCDRQGLVFRMSKQVLGTGACGVAFLGLSQTGALVAIKEIELPLRTRAQNSNLSDLNRRRLRRKGIQVESAMEKTLDGIINEVSLLSRLRHANIMGYISSAIWGNKLLIVMELGSGGSLYDLIQKFGSIKESRARRYLRDVLQGLEYLHRKNIVHRDIKPQNVLLLETGLCKLTDFGTSQNLQKIANSCAPEGTPPYTAPEAARGKAEKASDIWSFGIMMLYVLSGSLPWPNMNQMTSHAFFYKVGHVESFMPCVDDKISHDAKQIVKRCCQRDPKERATARELLNNSFFNCTDTSTSCLVKDWPSSCGNISRSEFHL
ncbi:serine/threonine protein kinase [Trypanosoma brucei equiperdum]|uniref:Serine/threonine protein kinase n=1 Tax=Trypanosoma brucei equiperdum TaxID=630700 RepID=A0A3L6LC54_9TRYP|nr:serine/threonine protein kinase [Trypanosoma brucei equiperdum]